MNIATAVVIAVLAVAVVIAIIHLRTHRNSCSCDGACSGCAFKDKCNK